MSDDSRNSDYLLVEAKKRGFGEKENDAMNKVAEYRKRQSEFIEKLENGWIRDTLEQLLINCFKGKRLNFRHGYKNPRPHFCNRSTLIIHI